MKVIKKNKGFTLLECLITLSLVSIVIVIALNIYLTGYKLYRRQEYKTEVEENIRVILNRISETLRRTDHPAEMVSVSGKMLIIGSARYYLTSDSLQERIGQGTNNLGRYIHSFDPCLENNCLIVRIAGMGFQGEPPFVVEQIFYIGGE